MKTELLERSTSASYHLALQIASNAANGVTVDVEQRVPSQYRLVGESEEMTRLRKLITRVARTNTNVMITGESGTGKELVARNIHLLSNRRDGPFVPINCAAIPADLIESELFGHEKGAFTGAYVTRRGRFELTEGGTLFLDEIGEMPVEMQVKLLRVVQEKSFERVGGNKSIPTDVRIISATHQNLPELVKHQSFREDLFYRLNVFPLHVPPLRERTGDIELLVNHIQQMRNKPIGVPSISGEVMQVLTRYLWPGNVRELDNLLERLHVMYPDRNITADCLPVKYRIGSNESPIAVQEMRGGNHHSVLPAEGIDLKEFLQDTERTLIQQLLNESDGVVARAARRLKLRRTTLVEKMRKYEISV